MCHSENKQPPESNAKSPRRSTLTDERQKFAEILGAVLAEQWAATMGDVKNENGLGKNAVKR